MNRRIAIIGGGAAGYFGAAACAVATPQSQVTIYEKSQKVLQKVRISGGGRCNVTHACFVPKELTEFYPRGCVELLGPFNRFQPGDMLGWLGERGVETKIEEDNRIFPESDNSRTITDCLENAVADAGVRIEKGRGLTALQPPSEGSSTWKLIFDDGEEEAEAILFATGSSPKTWKILESLGHAIETPVPSLFTFNIKDPRLEGLPGIAHPAEVSIEGTKLNEYGPTLITHWGLSGPAVLRLSAWGARILEAKKYRFEVIVNWVAMPKHHVIEQLKELRSERAKQTPARQTAFELPSRLWKRLVEAAHLNEQLNWADLSNRQLEALADQLCDGRYQANGKSTFKDEFVTCGGVKLKEVNFKTMESKLFPGLYFAGEVLNIDAVTGGFNFQAAWTTSWIAGHAMAESVQNLD